jgi:cytochrome c oxidase cbb3-type subunit 3
MSAALTVFIVALTALNILGALWLLWWTRRRRTNEPAASAETTGHVWDGDLRELNNPLPRWWLWLFIITIVFALGYLVLYPGLGSYRGTLGWTSISQHEAEQRESEARAQQLLAKFAGKSVTELQHDKAALAVGRNLFNDNCILCHGSDARGAAGFPNLTDKDWLWGGGAETIEATITGGRTGVMIGWKDALGGSSGVEDMVAYVLSLSGRSVPAGDAANGKRLFMTNCIGCHGEDGRGNLLVGAPNLTDNIWLHGGSVETIRDVIANGRTGQMPAQLDRLGAERIRLLAAYVLSLGDGT